MLQRLANGSGELTEIDGPPALVEAVKAARVANNGSISIEDARNAAEVALEVRPAGVSRCDSTEFGSTL